MSYTFSSGPWSWVHSENFGEVIPPLTSVLFPGEWGCSHLLRDFAENEMIQAKSLAHEWCIIGIQR